MLSRGKPFRLNDVQLEVQFGQFPVIAGSK